MPSFLGQGEIPIPVGVKLLEEILPLFLRLVCSLVRELLVDGVPVNLGHLFGDFANNCSMKCFAVHTPQLTVEC